MRLTIGFETDADMDFFIHCNDLKASTNPDSKHKIITVYSTPASYPFLEISCSTEPMWTNDNKAVRFIQLND